MKEVTLRIPEKKFNFFMELMEQLGFEITSPAEIPEEDKTVVRERIRKTEAHPERLLDWERVKDGFNFDE